MTGSQPSSADQTRAALLSAGNLCWTPPARAELISRGQALPPGDQHLGEFLLIPSARRPRLLVPAGHPAAAAESVRRFSHALDVRERVVRTVLTGALRSGVLDRIVPDRMRVTVPVADAGLTQSLQAEASRLLGVPVLLSLGVGTPRANRKPVLQAISHSGQPLAFIKLGDNELTRQLLADEATALTRLAQVRPAGLTVPRLVHLGSWTGIDVLIQSALATPPWRSHRRSTVPFAAMRSLASAFDLGRVPLADSPSWQLITTGGAMIPDDARGKMFTQTAEAIGAELDGVQLRHGAWHGDWTPWNMAWAGGQVRIWDWERFAEGVPAGFDALHYVFNEHVARLPLERALDTLREDAAGLLRPLGVAPSEVDHVARWYLLDLCRRYLGSAASSAGAPLRARADHLLRYLYAAAHPGEPQPALPDWRTT